LEQLGGQSILRRTLRAFMNRADVGVIVLATQMPAALWSEADPEIERRLNQGWLRLSPGGDSRAASVRNALSVVPPETAWVAVHDAARPLVSPELITRVFATAVLHGAAAPALAVNLTVKEAGGPLPTRVLRTVPRHSLWAMQTPQAMRRADLQRAFDRCPAPLDAITDDAQVLELAGLDVWLVAGDERNIKVTTSLDLHVAEALIAKNFSGD
jgi:2-C-methyl-D-erythritol 4-phosphate cytidylyltransferase